MSDVLTPPVKHGTYLYGIPMEKLPSYRKAEPVGNKFIPRRETVNKKLLDEIMDYIEAHPQTWRQESWYAHVDAETGSVITKLRVETVEEQNSCGTSFCFAGHVAISQGFPTPPIYSSDHWVRTVDNGGWEESQPVEDFAADVLGLDEYQASALFDAANDMENLRDMVTLLKAFPGISGEDLELYGKYAEREVRETALDLASYVLKSN